MMPPFSAMIFPQPDFPFLRTGSCLLGSVTTTLQSPVLPFFPPSSACHASTLRGVRRPVGRFNAELLGVLDDQPLPGGDLHRVRADDAANRLAREETIENVEGDVPARSAPRDEAAIDLVPQRQARAASKV